MSKSESRGSSSVRRLCRGAGVIAIGAAAIASLLALPRLFRLDFDPVYEGKVRLPCSSIEGTMTLLGASDPSKMVYANDAGDTSIVPAPGLQPAYRCTVVAVQLVVLENGEVFSPAFVVDQARFTGWLGGVRKHREVRPVSRFIGYRHMRFQELFAAHRDIRSFAYLLIDIDDEDAVWRVFEFASDSEVPSITIPDLTSLPRVGECRLGPAYWEAYVRAAEEQGPEHWSSDSREAVLRTPDRL